jgi:hypothetical protein
VELNYLPKNTCINETGFNTANTWPQNCSYTPVKLKRGKECTLFKSLCYHKRNVSPNCFEIPSHSGQTGTHHPSITQTTNDSKDVVPYTLLVGFKLVQPLWKSVWRFLKKL